MRSSVLALSLIFILALSNLAAYARPAADEKFESLAKQYIEELLKMSPETATELGDHRYDNRLDDYSREGREKRRALAQKYLKALDEISVNNLSPMNRVDYRILHNRLEFTLFQIDELREYEWNPLVYNVGSAIYLLIARDFAPLRARLLNVRERLKAIPEVVAQAKLNLKNPPRVHTETAIAQNKGTISLVTEELNGFIAQVPDLKTELAPAQAIAAAALTDFGHWMETELLPRSTGDFRLGDALYRKKLRFTLESDLSKEEILRRAMADLQATQATMYEVALPLFKKYFPQDASHLNDRKFVIKAVLSRLAENHPTNETIVPLASEDVKKATDFVRAKNLVTLPTEPVKVIVMPEFQRGVAVAYTEPAGPLEKGGETFYAISPTPKTWTPARVESFFREYNNYMLEDVTVHEAMPGHYLQLAHSNQFKAPTMVRALFRSNTFAEGWAVYAEQLMAEQGYGGPEFHMQQLKMRLRTIINAIIDQKIHTEGMTEAEAVDFMMNEGFQEEGEAAGKWRRAILTSTQLSNYFVGVTEMNDIRRTYEAKTRGPINLRQLHDTMLSFGTPAPKYVREMMNL